MPLIAGKRIVLRIGVSTPSDHPPTLVRAVATIGGEELSSVRMISGPSDPDRRETYLEVELPDHVVTAGAALRVRLLVPGTGPADEPGHPATWPADGGASTLRLVSSPRLRVSLVRLHHLASGSLGVAVVGDREIGAVREAFLGSYPVSPEALEVRLHPRTLDVAFPITFDSRSDILDEIRTLRDADGAAPNDLYYGLLAFTHGCDDCRVAGIGNARVALGTFQPHDDPDASRYGTASDYEPGGSAYDWLRDLATAESVPFDLLRDVLLQTTERDSELDIALHEGGHAFGLPHVDCTGFRFAEDPDPGFPRSDGHIGLDAYDARHDVFLPARYTSDLMSYCMLTAISDHNYRRIYDTLVSGAP